MTAFVLIVLASVGTGVFAIYNLSSVTVASDKLAESMSKIDRLGELTKLAASLEAKTMKSHFEIDPSRRQAILTALKRDQVAFSNTFADYAKGVTDPAEADLVRSLKADWQHFLAVGEEILALDLAGERELADDVVGGDLSADAERFTASVQKVLSLHRSIGSENQSAATATSSATRTWIGGALALQTLFCLMVGSMLIVGVSHPVVRMTGVMRRLAADERDVRIPDTERRDEIGAMAQALRVFQHGMEEVSRLRETQAEQERRLKEQQKAEMHRLAAAFERAVGEVVATVASASAELQASAETLSAAAEQTSARSQAVSAGARSAAVGVDAVASAIDGLANLSRQVGTEISRSGQMTVAAVRQAQGTRGSMDELQSDAETVETVVAMINQIAAQTNLLALNATIEAARSGEAGRGFAVVANEVKALANQTGQATTSVTSSIEKMRNSTGRAREEITAVQSVIEELNGVAASIEDVVRRQTETASTVTQNVLQVSHITREVTANIEGVSQAAGQSSQAASQVLSASAELAQQSDRLKREVTSFLELVRAA